MLGAVLAHGPERDVLPLRTIVSNIAVKQVIVPAIGARSTPVRSPVTWALHAQLLRLCPHVQYTHAVDLSFATHSS